MQLRGHLEDIRLFSEKVAEIKTNISQRGKNSATKYFLIPREFRKDIRFNNVTSCQKLDFADKVAFVYLVDKTRINPSKRELAIREIEEKYRNEADNIRR